jgi:hypothetical protein
MDAHDLQSTGRLTSDWVTRQPSGTACRGWSIPVPQKEQIGHGEQFD